MSRALMTTFGRLRLDVENCLKELVDFGVDRAPARTPVAFRRRAPVDDDRRRLARHVPRTARRRSAPRTRSPSVQRFREMIGRDEKMLIVFEWIRTAAKSDISVLILGPTGSGKEVVARMIHELSRRGRENFQAVNCAALPDTLFESEIFGYEKGAFTGAVRPQAGPRGAGRPRHAVPRRDRRSVARRPGQAAAGARGPAVRAPGRPEVDRGGLPADFGDQPAARRSSSATAVSAKTSITASTRSRSGCRRCASGRSTSRCWPTASSPATAPPTACRSTPRAFSAEALSRALSPTTGRATSASWRARSRARRCPSPGRVIRDSDIEFLHAHTPVAPATDARPRLPTLRDAERAHIQRVLEAVSWNKKEAARVLEISRGTLYRKILEYQLDQDAGPARADTPA